MGITVLLSPIHIFYFFLLWIIIYKSKTTTFLIQREIIITSLFRKLTEVSTNNFKIDIDGFFYCFSAKILIKLFINQLEILSHFVVKQEVEALHRSYLKTYSE